MELEFYTAVFEKLREEINHVENIRSTAANVSGAKHILEFLRTSYSKFRGLAHSNPNTDEEILLICQLSNARPAFGLEHCEEMDCFEKLVFDESKIPSRLKSKPPRNLELDKLPGVLEYPRGVFRCPKKSLILVHYHCLMVISDVPPIKRNSCYIRWITNWCQKTLQDLPLRHLPGHVERRVAK